MTERQSGLLHVAAGVLIDTDGRLLLTQRPAGTHLAGLWEFPGGKLEPGESPYEALVRELHEEIGITVTHAKPLLQLPWHYGDRLLLLDTWRIGAWLGTPRSMEGQALQWLLPHAVDRNIMAPADAVLLDRVIDAR